ncbi:MAG: hypothetical protein U9R58_04675 [Chloroflexota bacterium]|nr:hypothetical protein [Chloroflexota bacterium]
MSQTSPETKRLQILLSSLIILILLILAVVFILLAYPKLIAVNEKATNTPIPTQVLSKTETPLPTITLTPSPSRTFRPTPTQTITLTPTKTAIPTPTTTPPGPPTLTPAQPIIGDPYQLVDWLPDNADHLITLMEDYPNTLPEDSRGENNELYYDSFFYATIAEKEGILRFPDSPLADEWRWALAYDLAQIGDAQASEEYGKLITDALNRGDVDIWNLSNWFSSNEPRMSLYTIELEPIPGYIRSYLLDVRGRGSGYIVLLETNAAFQYDVLLDLFDFINVRDTRSIISDLTGDGGQEIGIYYMKPEDDITAERPIVFDMAEIPPTELTFRPSVAPFKVGVRFVNYWGVTRIDQHENAIFFETRVFPACPVTIRQEYRWSDLFFELVDTQFTFEPNPQTLSYCENLADHAASTWGYKPAIQLMEMLLPVWPPETDTDGKPYPAEAIDEWRYKLGIYYAQLGNTDITIEYLSDLTENPGDPGSRWVSQAGDFLSVYNKPEDLYAACTKVQDCNAKHALDFLINTHSRENEQDTVEFLWQSGVTLRASGYFDFDRDGQTERWFTVQHRPLEELSLWILAISPDGEKGMYVAPINSNKPEISYIDDSEPPVVVIDSTTVIRLERDPDTSESYLTYPSIKLEFSDPFVEGMNAARDALFAGVEPKLIIKMLLDLQIYPGLRCEATWTCDPYYYYLGLAYELAGEERNAINTYLYLWWNYSRSPFTTMARLKLQGTITPTPTIIPTPATLTPTPTPGEPAATSTPAGPYPSPSPQVTSPPYPYPSPTNPAYP